MDILSTAFSFQLLDWVEALFLECQVSMQDFAAAFEFLIKSNVLDQVSEVLTVFTDVNPEY